MAQICLPFGSNFSKAVGASQFWFDLSTTLTRGNIFFFPFQKIAQNLWKNLFRIDFNSFEKVF